MELNEKNKKVMVIEKKPETNIDIRIAKIQLEQVKDFKYLSTNIWDNRKCKKEVRIRIALAKMALWKHKELLKSNISMRVKNKMIRSYIWSVVKYDSEAWTINKEIPNKIDAFEVLKILKNSWKDKVNNKEELRRMGADMHLMKSIARRKAAFFGHIM